MENVSETQGKWVKTVAGQQPRRAPRAGVPQPDASVPPPGNPHPASNPPFESEPITRGNPVDLGVQPSFAAPSQQAPQTQGESPPRFIDAFPEYAPPAAERDRSARSATQKPLPPPYEERSKNVFERKAEADEASRKHLENASSLKKASAGMFHSIGNGVRLTGAAMTHPLVWGPAGAFVGAVRGLFFGTLGALVVGGLLGAGALALPVLAVTLVSFTAYHGVKSWNNAMVRNTHGDKIATAIDRKTGALPVPGGPENAKNMPSLAQTTFAQPDLSKPTWKDRYLAEQSAAQRTR